MGITAEFDPARDGWSFQNFSTDASLMTWDLYRRTYLAINPTNSIAEAPLDVAFYEVFKVCAEPGDCEGMDLLASSIFQLGGYFGFGAPAFFYQGDSTGQGPGNNFLGPSRQDLREVINIMHGRQFGAPGIQNFVELGNANQLNDGLAAFGRIQDGLESGDYQLLALSNDFFGAGSHVVVPYRAEEPGDGTKVLWVGDPDHPYSTDASFYDGGHNKIVISGAQDWEYDQTQSNAYSGDQDFKGSNHGWFFAMPATQFRHKSRQPISVGYALSTISFLLVAGVGQAPGATQLEDAEGRRLLADDGVSPEQDPARRLEGAFPWPWPGRKGAAPAHLFVLNRAAGAAPLTVTCSGDDYRVLRLSQAGLTEVRLRGGRGRDRVRIAADGAVELKSSAAGRVVDVQRHSRSRRGEWTAATTTDLRTGRATARLSAV